MKSIYLKNVKKAYQDKIIFENLNLELVSGKVYFLTSFNGSGKTTFLRCLLNETNYNGLIDLHDLKIIYLPEKPILASYVRVNTFLKSFYLLNNKNYDEKRVDKYYDLFHIAEYKNYYLRALSKGTKQKIMIIKTLLEDSDVYLFDEPLNGLDLDSRNSFMKEIYDLSQKDKIIVIATHYYDDYQFTNKEIIILNEDT